MTDSRLARQDLFASVKIAMVRMWTPISMPRQTGFVRCCLAARVWTRLLSTVSLARSNLSCHPPDSSEKFARKVEARLSALEGRCPMPPIPRPRLSREYCQMCLPASLRNANTFEPTQRPRLFLAAPVAAKARSTHGSWLRAACTNQRAS